MVDIRDLMDFFYSIFFFLLLLLLILPAVFTLVSTKEYSPLRLLLALAILLAFLAVMSIIYKQMDRFARKIERLFT
ncbi:MAG: hypothetical protein NZ902_06065 [Acidilobaceae archaeon]|nr:hypothetical protein [Acidilobaceae archaeon]MCX8166130.1 hypothetical protein [Acidilobaceae archaeon]MDW7974773.1 hypothetical protein [Sulfolobales archaeon]